MTLAERVAVWNLSYERMPEEWRFQFVVWLLLALGTVNMLMTVVAGFPFALLVVLAILVLGAIRVPYLKGWIKPASGAVSVPPPETGGSGWMVDLNRRYEAMPEWRRFWVYPTVLLIAGAINMVLTISFWFPFGLLVVLTLLALVAIRAPYTYGWFGAGPADAAVEAPAPAVIPPVDIAPGNAAPVEATPAYEAPDTADVPEVNGKTPSPE